MSRATGGFADYAERNTASGGAREGYTAVRTEANTIYAGEFLPTHTPCCR